ncbi:hypothetical protein PIB30_078336 [Stylosanthes scabra]|uniref:Pentatricopeptide repeat-containing protein n=1 Tax=Stylosanthes scabra TaxID=79078 RepID=A0ABU6UQ93_9FABA|nr:hypothetical protein [Stylosanthes scabra]
MRGETYLNVTNSLIGCLISMGKIEEAEKIFYRLRERNHISYNLMIKGYAMSGLFEKSKKLFNQMSLKNLASLNTMISVYSKNCELDEAVKLFDETKDEKNPLTWNSMMTGYIQNGQYMKALKLYVKMRRLSVDYSRSTFSVLFCACSSLGSFQQGRLLHGQLTKTPFQANVYVGTALVDFYSKCGSLADAQRSFLSIFSPNVAAWTALINGYAYHGLDLRQFYSSTQFDEGLRIFHSMEELYKVIPSIEHYTCVVDLLGRSGYVREAEEFIRKMPIEADGVIWGALLHACWFWKDMEVGEKAAEKLFSLALNPTVPLVILSNMYAVLGRWRQKSILRKRLQKLKLRKDPGCSWIELNNNIHLFSVRDKTHPYSDVIYATVEHLAATINSVIPFNYLYSKR